VDDLSCHLLGLTGIDGVTFSGGEPMAQAAALVRLVDRLAAERPTLSYVCYTGYTLDHLRCQGTTPQRDLLARLDILIDGPYVAGRHTDLRWRGSDNQTVHFLSPRLRDHAPAAGDRGTWIEFELLPDGGLRWMGIPPVGFREAVPGALASVGIEISTAEDTP
jgi:anaerobic ribonucleoside-triphosphate reductase activating protein